MRWKNLYMGTLSSVKLPGHLDVFSLGAAAGVCSSWRRLAFFRTLPLNAFERRQITNSMKNYFSFRASVVFHIAATSSASSRPPWPVELGEVRSLLPHFFTAGLPQDVDTSQSNFWSIPSLFLNLLQPETLYNAWQCNLPFLSVDFTMERFYTHTCFWLFSVWWSSSPPPSLPSFRKTSIHCRCNCGVCSPPL